MKTSARNAFRCTVTEIRHGSVNCEVIMRLSSHNELTAIITEESVSDLGIAVGREITALVKSSFVMLSPGSGPLKVSARNKVSGVISSRDDGGVNSEVAIDIGDGKTIIAVVTIESAKEMDLKVGDPVVAFFKSSHVILAVD